MLPAVVVLYAGYRFGWTEKVVGLALAAVGASSVVVQGTLIGLLGLGNSFRMLKLPDVKPSADLEGIDLG